MAEDKIRPIVNYSPDKDGIDHINVYSKGKTDLGRALTNMSDIGFDSPIYGKWPSVESFWHYLMTGCKHEQFRYLNCFEAKSLGKLLRKDHEGLSEYKKDVILEVIMFKLDQNKWLLNMLRNSTLPLTHYYVNGSRITRLPQYDWMIDELQRIRTLSRSKL